MVFHSGKRSCDVLECKKAWEKIIDVLECSCIVSALAQIYVEKRRMTATYRIMTVGKSPVINHSAFLTQTC